MRRVEMFECEICKEVYRNEIEAIECENRGKEKPLASVGDMVNYRVEMSGGFDDWFIELRISKIEECGHYFNYYFEEYNPDENIWEESMHFNSVWGNEEFQKLVNFK